WRYDTPRASVATPIIHIPPLMVRHHARLGLLSPDGGCVCCCGVIVLLLPRRVAWLVLEGGLVGAGCCRDVRDRGDSLIHLEARSGALIVRLREISYSRAAGDRCTGASHSADQDAKIGVAERVDHHRRQASQRGQYVDHQAQPACWIKVLLHYLPSLLRMLRISATASTSVLPPNCGQPVNLGPFASRAGPASWSSTSVSSRSIRSACFLSTLLPPLLCGGLDAAGLVS